MNYEELLRATEAGVEIWKPIIGYEGLYEISNLGRVKSIERTVKRGNHTLHIKGRIKTSFIDTSGYRIIMLCKDGKATPLGLHRLIAKAFIPNPENKPEVDHINTDRADCCLQNLRWVTHKENNNNEITLQNRRVNTYTPENIKRGMDTRKELKSKNGAKTVYQYTKNGQFIAKYYSMEEAKRKTGASHICEVLDDSTQTSGGFLWTSNTVENLQYKSTPNPTAKPVQLYDMDGNLIGEWKSILEASRQTGINNNVIARNIKAANPIKYRFRYKEGV